MSITFFFLIQGEPFIIACCGSNRRSSALLSPAGLNLNCLESDTLPLYPYLCCLCDWVVKWVQQAHLAEIKDLTAVWSVGFQVPGPGRVWVENGCSSQSRLPHGAVELHLRAM